MRLGRCALNRSPLRRKQRGFILVGKGRAMLGGAVSLPSIAAQLYPSGSDGAAYEMSDLGSVFQDYSGTTPGAVASAVALLLDESRGRSLSGGNLISNGDFSGGTTGWTYSGDGAVSVVSGALQFTQVTATFSRVFQSITCVVGHTYQVTATLTAATGNTTLYVNNSTSGTPATPAGTTGGAGVGTYTFYFTANATTMFFIARLSAAAGASSSIDNISVVEILGDHATQTATSSRPVETAYGSSTGLLFDGIDDGLATTVGGGGTTGFFWCGAVKVVGGDGTSRSIWSDVGANTGYRVRLASTNTLALGAGNGTAFTSATSTDSVLAGNTYVLTAWDDGTNLNVQVNLGSIVQAARPAVSAGGAGFSLGKDNNGTTAFANIAIFEMFYKKNGSDVSASLRQKIQRYCARMAGVSL